LERISALSITCMMANLGVRYGGNGLQPRWAGCMLYVHPVLKLGGGAVKSPRDALRLGAATAEVDDDAPPETSRPLHASEPDFPYAVFVPCFHATPSCTAAATSAS
jgi:hypothetical protein